MFWCLSKFKAKPVIFKVQKTTAINASMNEGHLYSSVEQLVVIVTEYTPEKRCLMDINIIVVGICKDNSSLV